MITIKRIHIILLCSLQSFILLGTQPSDGKNPTATLVEQAEIDRLKLANAAVEKKIWQELTAKLNDQTFGIVVSSGVKSIKLPGLNLTVARIPKKDPFALLEERLHALKTAFAARYQGHEKIESEIVDILEIHQLQNGKNKQGKTALMLAAQYGCLEGCKKLIELGAQFDAEDTEGKTALFYCFADQYHQRILNYIATELKKSNKQDVILNGLKFADRIEVVDHLWLFLDLEHKAEFVIQCDDITKPAYKNIRKSFSLLNKKKSKKTIEQMGKEVANLFDSVPADVKTTAAAATLATLADKMKSFPEISHSQNHKTAIAQLEEKLKEGFEQVKRAFNDEISPAEAERKLKLLNPELKKIVQTHRQTIHTERNENGQTALILAAHYACNDVLDELIKLGANLEDRDSQGKTALRYCSSDGYAIDLLCQALKKANKQHIILDALSHALDKKDATQLWSFLDTKHKTLFATSCSNPTSSHYADIRHEFKALKKQAIAQASAPSASASAAAMPAQEQAKSPTKQAAQQRRKAKKRALAQELAAQEAQKQAQKKEKEEAEAALIAQRQQQKDLELKREAELAPLLTQFENAHTPLKLKKAFGQWKKEFAAHKEQESIAQEHAKQKQEKRTSTIARKAFSAWSNDIKDKAKADSYAKKLAQQHANQKAQKVINQWKKMVHERKIVRSQELILRLIACDYAIALYNQIKSRMDVQKSDALALLELGAAQVNLLSSAQRIVRFYAERGYTNKGLSESLRAEDRAAKKRFLAVSASLKDEYSFGQDTHMISQFFANSQRKAVPQEEEMYQLFDAVRARDNNRVRKLLEPRLHKLDDEDLRLFRDSLRKELASKDEIPPDAMVHSPGARTIMSRLYLKRKGFNSVEEFVKSSQLTADPAVSKTIEHHTPDEPQTAAAASHKPAQSWATIVARGGKTGIMTLKPLK